MALHSRRWMQFDAYFGYNKMYIFLYITQCMLGTFTSSITTLLSLATVISEISCKISILNHSSKISQQQFAGNKFQKIDFQVPPFPSGPSDVTAWCRKTLKKSQQ